MVGKYVFVETHCHLVGTRGPQNTGETVKEAVEAGVVLILTAGIDVRSSELCVEAAKEGRILKACVGIHPWYADEYDGVAREKLSRLAIKENVVAISEIGLDFFGRMDHDWQRSENYIAKETQINAFRGQIGLAVQKGLPVIVHDRSTKQETLDILEEEDVKKVGGAIHGFTGDISQAHRCMELGLLLSISERALLRSDAEELRNAVQQVPLDWLTTETDSAAPEGVIKAAELIASLKGLKVQDVGQATTENLKRVLKTRL